MSNIPMNDKILNILVAVLRYKAFVVSHNEIVPEQKFDWFKKTMEYYFSLPLPEGMNKNLRDFEIILNYSSGYGAEIMDELMNTDLDHLDKFNWKNF